MNNIHRKCLAFLILFCVAFFTGCNVQQGKPIKTPETFQLIMEDVHTLSDGERVDLYRSNMRSSDVLYMIPNGSFILRVNESIYIQAADNLSDEQRFFIQTYYENQEPLFDIESELNKAYELYKARIACGIKYLNLNGNDEDDALFEPYEIDFSQRVVNHNDSIICVEQSYHLPVAVEDLRDSISSTNEVGGYYLSTVFDATTGDVINQYDLFTIPKEEIPAKLLEYSAYVGDEQLIAEMKEKMKPEYLSFGKKSISIWFPYGVVGDRMSYGESVNYVHVEDVLYPWAVFK